MKRSRVLVRAAAGGVRRAAAFALVGLFVVPACAGRSISRGDDEGGAPYVTDDDDDSGQGGSTAGTGVAATGNEWGESGGSFPSGGAFPTGGTVPTGGSFPTGGTPAFGGSVGMGGTITSGGTFPTGGVAGTCAADRPGDPIAGAGGRPINTMPECRGILRDAACMPAGTMCPNLACGLADAGRRQCACTEVWACTSCDFTGSWLYDRPCDIQQCPSGVADEVACMSDGTVCGPSANGEYCACWLSPTDGLSWDCDDPPSSWAL